MFNSICERRMQSKDMYAVILQIPQEEYFATYESLSEMVAEDIVRNHLLYHGDDGRPSGIRIRHDPNSRLVTINLYLSYDGNDHTGMRPVPEMQGLRRNGSEQG